MNEFHTCVFSLYFERVLLLTPDGICPPFLLLTDPVFSVDVDLSAVFSVDVDPSAGLSVDVHLSAVFSVDKDLSEVFRSLFFNSSVFSQ